MAETEAPAAPAAKQVVYCGVCSLPPEYCEFGGTTQKCEEWLQAHHPSLHSHLYSAEAAAATSKLTALSLSAQARADRDAAKKTAKAETAASREAARRATSKLVIRRVERNKRKYVTAVAGLEAFGVCGGAGAGAGGAGGGGGDLRRVAKELGRKFAAGSSVAKVPGGGEEIVVQGDLAEEIRGYVAEVWGDRIPEGNVEIVEEKKKKGAAAG